MSAYYVTYQLFWRSILNPKLLAQATVPSFKIGPTAPSLKATEYFVYLSLLMQNPHQGWRKVTLERFAIESICQPGPYVLAHRCHA